MRIRAGSAAYDRVATRLLDARLARPPPDQHVPPTHVAKATRSQEMGFIRQLTREIGTTIREAIRNDYFTPWAREAELAAALRNHRPAQRTAGHEIDPQYWPEPGGPEALDEEPERDSEDSAAGAAEHPDQAREEAAEPAAGSDGITRDGSAAEGAFAHYPAEVERARDAYIDGTMAWDDLSVVCADHDVTTEALFAATTARDLEAGE